MKLPGGSWSRDSRPWIKHLAGTAVLQSGPRAVPVHGIDRPRQPGKQFSETDTCRGLTQMVAQIFLEGASLAGQAFAGPCRAGRSSSMPAGWNTQTVTRDTLVLLRWAV